MDYYFVFWEAVFRFRFYAILQTNDVIDYVNLFEIIIFRYVENMKERETPEGTFVRTNSKLLIYCALFLRDARRRIIRVRRKCLNWKRIEWCRYPRWKFKNSKIGRQECTDRPIETIDLFPSLRYCHCSWWIHDIIDSCSRLSLRIQRTINLIL